MLLLFISTWQQCCFILSASSKWEEMVWSFLFHYITNYTDHKIKHLHVFCNSVGGQNKQFTIIMQYMNKIIWTNKGNISNIIWGFLFRMWQRQVTTKINLKTKVKIPDEFFKLIKQSWYRLVSYKVTEVQNNKIKGWPNFNGRYYVKNNLLKTQPIKK